MNAKSLVAMLVILLCGSSRAIGPSKPNMFPKLVPPAGKAWRGACQEGGRMNEYDPASWSQTYGKPLHIYRAFPVPGGEEIWPSLQRFVADGGIVFYAIQPKGVGCWKEAASVSFRPQIKKYAAAVKSLAPHQVMVAAGFESDHHVNDIAGAQGYGSTQEYKSMFDNFYTTFTEENVTNAVWVVDFAGEHNKPEVLLDLWPDGHRVDWLMWNFFQSKNNASKLGRCGETIGAYYDLLMSMSNDHNRWAELPFALGAWGTRNESFFGHKTVSLEAREDCLDKMKELFANREKYPKLQAQIYFNADQSRIDNYPPLIKRLSELNSIDTFDVGNVSAFVQV